MLGDVQVAQGDLAGARASYEQGREIKKKLARHKAENKTKENQEAVYRIVRWLKKKKTRLCLKENMLFH